MARNIVTNETSHTTEPFMSVAAFVAGAAEMVGNGDIVVIGANVFVANGVLDNVVVGVIVDNDNGALDIGVFEANVDAGNEGLDIGVVGANVDAGNEGLDIGLVGANVDAGNGSLDFGVVGANVDLGNGDFGIVVEVADVVAIGATSGTNPFLSTSFFIAVTSDSSFIYPGKKYAATFTSSTMAAVNRHLYESNSIIRSYLQYLWCSVNFVVRKRHGDMVNLI